jgi:hypothetical protein
MQRIGVTIGVSLLMIFAVGCSSESSSGVNWWTMGESGEQPSVEFDLTMSAAELYKIAKSHGLDVNEEMSKEELIYALGTALGCTCPTTECGASNCGSMCGECGEGNTCFEGACVAVDDEQFYDFSPYSHATSARFVGGATRVTYTATAATQDLIPPYEPPFAKIKLEFIQETFSGLPGIYDLATSYGPECDTCVTAYQYCNEIDCFNKFKVESGELVLAAAGQPGSRLSGYLKNVTFIEYDKTQPVDKPTKKNAKRWYVDRFFFDQDVPEVAVAANNCIEEGTGKDLYTNIANYKLENCYGEWEYLHDTCGSVAAKWITLTAGW